MKYKLIVSDFDDTILNSNMEYSEELLAAVRDYEAAGGHFHIATGRMTDAILPYARAMGLKGDLLSFQGSVVSDVESGKIVEEFPIPYATALEIGLYAEQRGWYYHIYDGDKFILKEHTSFSRIYQHFCKCGTDELGHNVSDFIRDNRFSPPKLLIMAAPDEVPSIRAEVTEKFGNVVHVNTSKDWMVEVVANNIDKGIAVSRLAARLGVKREETICIGDSMNDAPMIAWAGLGIILANGSEEAKGYADLVGPSNDENGVAKIIRKYGLEQNYDD